MAVGTYKKSQRFAISVQSAMKLSDRVIGTSLNFGNMCATSERRVSRLDSPVRFSRNNFSGKIRGCAGGGRFTDDRLEVFGGTCVVEIQQLEEPLRNICENGFEHHVAASFFSVAPVVREAVTCYCD